MTAVFTDIGKGNNITCLIVITALIGHPHLNLIDLRSAGDVWHRCHRLLVMVAEEMREEEVAVLIVGIAGNVEFRHLRAALTAHRLGLAVLLGNQCLYLQLAELQVCLDTEQSFAATDE